MTDSELREQVAQLIAQHPLWAINHREFAGELADRIIALVRKARQAMPGMGPGLHHYPSELPLPERAVKGARSERMR